MPFLKHVPDCIEPVSVTLLQLSIAEGVAHCALAHVSNEFNMMFAGQNKKRGFMVSFAHGFVDVKRFTVTVKEQYELLPLASVAT